MKQANKWSLTQTSLAQTLRTMEHRLRLGLVTFSDQAQLEMALGGSVKDLEGKLKSIQPSGATYMKMGMEQAIAHLKQSLLADTVKLRPTYILLMTDGAPTDRCPEDEVKQLRNLTVGAVTYPIKTFVVGFGDQVNALCLNNLAILGGTARDASDRYWKITQANDLSLALQQVVVSATTVEICNGFDDDCDGYVDNLTGSQEPLKEVCQQGLCRGMRQCSQGQWSSCLPDVKPTDEICNSKDDDCDGYIDNVQGKPVPINRSCQHACGTFKQACIRGYWTPCSDASLREICNGKDDDCDGQVDEHLDRPCDHCSLQKCENGQWTGCQKQTEPRREECNGWDDDCDGYIDNAPGSTKESSLTRTCLPPLAFCGVGTQQCVNGAYTSCIAPKISPEVCDGKDNDCNGVIDDPWTQWLGTNNTCQTSCGQGKYQCKPDGSGVFCAGQGQWKEICDGKDNDCNGQIDELWPTKGQACSQGNGACQTVGVMVCNPEQNDTICQVTQAAQPSAEVCDGKDNDCDGKTDEDLVRSCSVNCKKGTQRCLEGVWTACTPTDHTTTVCSPSGSPDSSTPLTPKPPEQNATSQPNPVSYPAIRIQVFGCGCSTSPTPNIPLGGLPLLFLFLLLNLRRLRRS